LIGFQCGSFISSGKMPTEKVRCSSLMRQRCKHSRWRTAVAKSTFFGSPLKPCRFSQLLHLIWGAECPVKHERETFLYSSSGIARRLIPKARNFLPLSLLRPSASVSGEESAFSAFSSLAREGQLILLTPTIFW